jgi:hypothetical protein
MTVNILLLTDSDIRQTRPPFREEGQDKDKTVTVKHVLRRELFPQYATDNPIGRLQIIFEPKAVANVTFMAKVVV